MIRKSTILKSLTALVMSALSSTAVQAEVLVPIDQSWRILRVITKLINIKHPIRYMYLKQYYKEILSF